MTGVRIAHLPRTDMIQKTETLSEALIFRSLIRTCLPFMYWIDSSAVALLWQIQLPDIVKL